MPRNSDDRDRRSWRDVDRNKDKSSHIDRKDPYAKHKGRKAQSGPTSGYKSALDKFFDGGSMPEQFKHLAKAKEQLSGGGSKRQKILKQLREAIGRDEVETATSAILKMDGQLPEEPEALVAVLRHSDESIVRDALAGLTKLAAEAKVKRTELLRQRLRQVEELADEGETARMAAELLRSL